jgi:hypothetical protein
MNIPMKEIEQLVLGIVAFILVVYPLIVKPLFTWVAGPHYGRALSLMFVLALFLFGTRYIGASLPGSLSLGGTASSLTQSLASSVTAPLTAEFQQMQASGLFQGPSQ